LRLIPDTEFFPRPIKNPGIVRGFFYARGCECTKDNERATVRPRRGVIWFDANGRHCRVLLRGTETHTRSILKAVSWRTLGTLDTFAISWFLTGRIEIAGSIAALEIITKIGWYYLHERVWNAISWGLRS
jgi:uncharacterized membrane protein